MKKSLFISFIALSVVLFSCQKETITPEPTPDVAEMGGCSAIRSSSPLPLDHATINSVAISGHCLNLEVFYSGGCENHQFDLSWNGAVLESFPPQVNVVLSHDSNGDLCKAAILQMMSFNLKKVELKGYNAVKVNVYGPTSTTPISVLYNY